MLPRTTSSVRRRPPERLEVSAGGVRGGFELTAGGGAELRRDGQRLLSVAIPLAVDAQGRPVDVRYGLSGTDLRIEVDHHGRDLAYPILVDPTYVRIEQADTGFYNWAFGTPWPGFFNGGYCPWCSPDSGLWLQTTAGRFFGHATWGWWTMPTPNYAGGTAYTFRAEWAHLRHRAPIYACITAGLYIPSAATGSAAATAMTRSAAPGLPARSSTARG